MPPVEEEILYVESFKITGNNFARGGEVAARSRPS